MNSCNWASGFTCQSLMEPNYFWNRIKTLGYSTRKAGLAFMWCWNGFLVPLRCFSSAALWRVIRNRGLFMSEELDLHQRYINRYVSDNVQGMIAIGLFIWLF